MVPRRKDNDDDGFANDKVVTVLYAYCTQFDFTKMYSLLHRRHQEDDEDEDEDEEDDEDEDEDKKAQQRQRG